MLKTKESTKEKFYDMKPRFIVKPKKLPPETQSAIVKVIKAENKVISKVRKKAQLAHIQLCETHIQLTLYAMREHLRQCLKDVMKNKLP